MFTEWVILQQVWPEPRYDGAEAVTLCPPLAKPGLGLVTEPDPGVVQGDEVTPGQQPRHWHLQPWHGSRVRIYSTLIIIMSSCSVLGTHRWQLCFPSVCQSWTGDRVWDMSSVLVWRNYYPWCRQHSGHWAWCQCPRPVCPECWPLTTSTFIKNNAKHKTCTAIYDTGHVALMLILYLIARFLYNIFSKLNVMRAPDGHWTLKCTQIVTITLIPILLSWLLMKLLIYRTAQITSCF